MKDELKPCPFCGSEAAKLCVVKDENIAANTNCTDPECIIGFTLFSKSAWNRRVKPKIDTEKIEEIIERYAKNSVTNYRIINTSGEDETRSFSSGSHIDLKGLAKAIIQELNK